MRWCYGDLRQKKSRYISPATQLRCSMNGLIHLLCGHKFQKNLALIFVVVVVVVVDVGPKQHMRIQGWVSQRSSGSEENRACISLFNRINMKWMLQLSLLSTLSPRYLADLTFSKVPFMDDVRGRDKFLFVGDTNAWTRQGMELRQPSLFPFLKGIDVVSKLDSVSCRCNLLFEYTVICEKYSAWVSNKGW